MASLTPEEFQQLRKGVHSPFFNTNPSVTGLFEAVRKEYPDFDSSPKAMKRVFKKLFPKEAFNEPKLRRLFTFLKRVVERVMACMEVEQDVYVRGKLLNQSFQKRNLYDLFVLKTKELLEQTDQRPWQNANYFFERMQLLKAQYAHPQHNKYDLHDQTLELLMDSMDAFFALSKIKMGIALRNKAKIMKTSYHLRVQAALEVEVEGLLGSNDLYRLYMLSLHLLEEREEADFETYEELLFKHITALEQEDQVVLFYNGLNHAVRQLNKGETSIRPHILRWYELGLEEGILLRNKEISPGTFGNIVHFGCLEEKFDWTLSFIEKYAPLLNTSVREDEMYCSLALVNFYQKNYEKIILTITYRSFAPEYQLRSKNIQIRTYFELFLKDFNQLQILESTMLAYEKLLYRSDLYHPNKVQSHLDFVQLLKGLVKRVAQSTAPAKIRKWYKQSCQKRGKFIFKDWMDGAVERL